MYRAKFEAKQEWQKENCLGRSGCKNPATLIAIYKPPGEVTMATIRCCTDKDCKALAAKRAVDCFNKSDLPTD